MKKFATTLLALTILCQLGFAQKRPTVGLALSGGSAKGFSHIGVLEILDSLGIQVDYVAGTSMGAIIGGLYAIGYEPGLIEQEITQANWDDLMDPVPNRKYELFSSKDSKQRNLFTVGLKDWKIKLPAGLNSANKVYQKFNNLTIGYHGDYNFLEFPRGFVCIGADLNKGEQVVFSSGSLPDAMRASMSIPTMFAPHEYKGVMFVDGGTINNFPTDELKKLGCDIIIGVDVQTTKDDTVDISLTKVLEKSAMFRNSQTSAEREELCDILIKPELKGMAASNFNNGAAFINQGKKAARLHLDELVKLAEQMRNYPGKSPPKPYAPLDSIKIEAIKIEGLQWVSEKFVYGTMAIEPQSTASINDLEEGIAALYGSNYFELATFTLEKDSNERTTLIIKVKENTNDLDLGLGFHHDPDFQTSILINIATRNSIIKGSRFNLDVILSERPRLNFLYEVDRGIKPGFGIRSNFRNTKPDYYIERQFYGSYVYDDWTTAVYAMASLHNMSTLRIGGELNYSYFDFQDVPDLRTLVDPDGDSPDATKVQQDHFNLFGEFSIDVLNNRNYPTKGHYFLATTRYSTSETKNLDEVFDEHFLLLNLEYNSAFTISNWLTVIPDVFIGLSLIKDPTYSYSYQIGGLGQNYFHNQVPFLGYRYFEMRGLSNFAKGGIEFRGNFFSIHHLSAMLDYGIYSPRVESYFESSQVLDLAGVGIKYGLASLVGPIEITVHKNLQGGSWLFYLNIGYWF